MAELLRRRYLFVLPDAQPGRMALAVQGEPRSRGQSADVPGDLPCTLAASGGERVHAQAMPVLLTPPVDWDAWLGGSVDEA